MLRATLTLIVSDRAYNLSRQNRLVLRFFTCLYFAVVSVSLFLSDRTLSPVADPLPFPGTMVYKFLPAHGWVVTLRHNPVTHLTEFADFSSHAARGEQLRYLT